MRPFRSLFQNTATDDTTPTAEQQMTAPVRIRLSRAKGWRMPPNTVKVDRTTRWGNPFKVGDLHCPNAEEAVRMFRARLPGGKLFRPAHPESHMGQIAANLNELRGKNLACWCPLDAPCHADVLLELANREPDK